MESHETVTEELRNDLILVQIHKTLSGGRKRIALQKLEEIISAWLEAEL